MIAAFVCASRAVKGLSWVSVYLLSDLGTCLEPLFGSTFSSESTFGALASYHLSSTRCFAAFFGKFYLGQPSDPNKPAGISRAPLQCAFLI
jgi:hypothetical protein